MTGTFTHARAPASMFALIAGFVLVGSAGGCREGEDEHPLVVRAPARIAQALTSTDEALCERLVVDLTLREENAAGAEVDRVQLTPGAVCEWDLDDEELLLNRGAYRMLVRFTAAGSYVGRPECEDVGASPLWVGAYWIESVPFPFPPGFGGFTEDLFISTPEDDAALADIESRLGDSGISFDLDQDGFDNLGELAGESNPCVPNQPPRVQVDATPLQVLENDPVTLQISTDEPGGLQHDVVVSLAHEHGSAIAPERAEVVLRPHDPADMTVDSPLPGQSWSLQAAVDDPMSDSPTAASWTLTFVPDEPFVGAVLVTAFARQRGGGPTFDGAPSPITIDVENVLDPVRVLVEDATGTLVPATTLDFAEVGAEGGPTTLRLKAESQDLGSQIAGTLALVSGPAGMTPGEDVGFLTLSWSPDNVAATLPPAEGHQVELQFTSDDGELVGQSLQARVTPTFNDPPQFASLQTVNANLSPSAFEFKRLRFDVVDPDRVSESLADEPECTLEVWPEGDPACATPCCTDAFSSLECAADGEIDEDTWHMVATLTPGPDYFTACGDEPSFIARLEVTDTSPADAQPLEDKTIRTEGSCGTFDPEDPCWEDLVLRTSGLTQAVTVAGWGGPISGDINGTTAALVDGVTGYAVMGIKVELPTDTYAIARVAVVDLNDPPTVMRIYDGVTELERLSDFLNYLPAGVVDEVNHRAVVYGRKEGAAVMAEIQLEPPFDVTTWPIGDFCMGCTSSECGSNPVVDGDGTVWVPCGRNDDGTLARLTGAGVHTQVDLGVLIESGSGVPGSAFITDDEGDPWLLWPDRAGVAAVDLTTFDDAVPLVLRATLPETYDDYGMEGFAVSHDGREAYFAYNQSNASGGDQAEIVRIRMTADLPEVSVPLVFGAKSATSNGSLFHRILQRQPAPGALVSEPELLITGGGADERAMIDTDAWALLPFPRPAEDYALSGIKELHESPMPDYYAAVVNGSAFKGLVLFPWDPAQTPVEQDLGVPGSGDIKQTWVTVDHGTNKMLISKNNEVVVIDFPAAP